MYIVNPSGPEELLTLSNGVIQRTKWHVPVHGVYGVLLGKGAEREPPKLYAISKGLLYRLDKSS
jgi:hypothetical protein